MTNDSKKFIGALGENMAAKYLTKNGYDILDRNFRRPWGEIDIVAQKLGIIHFVEVKSISCVNVGNGVSDKWRGADPEDNVNYFKLKRLNSVIQSYLGYKNVKQDQEWQIDILAVFVDVANQKAQMRFTEDVG